MNIPFKHFIITLFNLPLWKADKNNVETQTCDWLDNRLDLFEKYCLPSVFAQTNQNFIWICLCDINTPEPYLSRIKAYKDKVNQFCPHFLDLNGLNIVDVEELAPFIRKIVKEYIEEKDEYIISTNLDNDDSIHVQMVEKLQSLISRDYSCKLYSFNWGYQYFTDISLILKMRYPHNHFLTLVESSSSVTTILPYAHATARKSFEVVDIKDFPFWIEFVHNRNQGNDLRITSRIGYSPVLRSMTLKSFELDICIKWYRQLFLMTLYFPFRWTNRACNRLIRKMNKGYKYIIDKK